MNPNSGIDMFQSETGLEDDDDEEGMFVCDSNFIW